MDRLDGRQHVGLFWGLPRPAPLYLHNQRPAQKGADQHQQAQHDHALQRGLQRHSVDDIGRDQHLQAQQQRPPQADLEPVVELAALAVQGKVHQVAQQRQDDGADDDDHGQHLDEDRGALDPIEDGAGGGVVAE